MQTPRGFQEMVCCPYYIKCGFKPVLLKSCESGDSCKHRRNQAAGIWVTANSGKSIKHCFDCKSILSRADRKTKQAGVHRCDGDKPHTFLRGPWQSIPMLTYQSSYLIQLLALGSSTFGVVCVFLVLGSFWFGGKEKIQRGAKMVCIFPNQKEMKHCV